MLFEENFKNYLPKEDTKGPKARASAPSDLRVPITAPFWSARP